MLNKVRGTTSVSSIVVRVLVSTVAVTAVLLLVLLAAASANTEFFDRYYQWLYAANVAVALIFLMVVTALVLIIIYRLRKGKFGTRLLAKLAFFMALVGVLGLVTVCQPEAEEAATSNCSISSYVPAGIVTPLDASVWFI